MSWDEVDGVLEAGVAHGVCTAAVLLAGCRGELVHQRALGRQRCHPGSPAVTLNTLFDLASLTKTLATTLALLVLVQQGRLSLETTLGELLPGTWLPKDKRLLTLTSLLTHQSGLPAWKPFYETVLTLPAEERPDALEKLAAATPLEHTPGPLTIYSDLGFMLLKAVVEAAAGQKLDAFCQRFLYEPLGLGNMGFNPRHRPGGQDHPYAATEPGLIPGRLDQGEVHDENAWSAGGVAGHAGLFGTGPEVFVLASRLYQAHQASPAQDFFDPALMRRFMACPPGARRALGFDVPADREASCGRFFSQKSVGHLGFTGVSYWIDLELGQIVVLLTNRVHLGRDNERIRPFRPRVYEAASRALGFSRRFRG